MPMVPAAFVHQSRLDSEFAKARHKLGKEIVRVKDMLAEVTSRIANLIIDE